MKSAGKLVLFVLVCAGLWVGYNHFMTGKRTAELKDLKAQLYVKEELLGRIEESAEAAAAVADGASAPIVTVDTSQAGKLKEETDQLRARIHELESMGLRYELTEEDIRALADAPAKS